MFDLRTLKKMNDEAAARENEKERNSLKKMLATLKREQLLAIILRALDEQAA